MRTGGFRSYWRWDFCSKPTGIITVMDAERILIDFGGGGVVLKDLSCSVGKGWVPNDPEPYLILFL